MTAESALELPRGRRVLVTGGAGFVGSHLVELLCQDNEVTVLDDLSTGKRANLAGARHPVELVVGDVRDPATVERAVRDQDLVYHLAILNLRLSLSDPQSNASVNSMGTLQVALACAARRVERLVYVSSSEIYGNMTRPGSLPAPTTVYASSKLAGEHHVAAVARTTGLPVSICRPFNAYGPRAHLSGPSAEVIPRFALRLRAGWPLPIFGGGGQTREFTWVQDLVRGVAAAGALSHAGAGAGAVASEAALIEGPFDLAHPQPISVREVAEVLAQRLTGRAPELKLLTARPGDVQAHMADPGPARERMGFVAPTTFAQGVDRFLAWLEEAVPDPMTVLAAEANQDERNWMR